MSWVADAFEFHLTVAHTLSGMETCIGQDTRNWYVYNYIATLTCRAPEIHHTLYTILTQKQYSFTIMFSILQNLAHIHALYAQGYPQLGPLSSKLYKWYVLYRYNGITWIFLNSFAYYYIYKWQSGNSWIILSISESTWKRYQVLVRETNHREYLGNF